MMEPRALGVYRPSPRGAGRKWGSRGFAPLGCLPLWGREGVTLANPMRRSKKTDWFFPKGFWIRLVFDNNLPVLFYVTTALLNRQYANANMIAANTTSPAKDRTTSLCEIA